MKRIYIVIAIAAAHFGAAVPAQAGMFELSMLFSYRHSHYSETSYSWTRRWGASVGYHFTERSGVEFSFQDSFERTFITNSQDTNFHDTVMSVNWIQELLGRQTIFQPYVKAGVGQLNRDATGNYGGLYSPPLQVDSVTVVLGMGFRVYFQQNLGFKTEVTSYLSGGSISTWKDNIAVDFGASFYF
ncbi:MAG: outer membrane beta-barrel protein [Bacteriovoracia bacterium]